MNHFRASAVESLRCLLCEAVWQPGDTETTCPACGIDGILDPIFDYERVRRQLNVDVLARDDRRSLWRYLALLPVPLPAQAVLPNLQVGWTPIYEAPRLAAELGLAALHVKDDGRNPTGSFKDRASAIGATRAAALGATDVACASTGNAASSLAGFAAALGLRARIFVPANAPRAKVAQLLIYGATVFLVEGGYEPAFELCEQAIAKFGWYNRNCAVNPYLVEGKKTGGLEIAEQMRQQLPDVVVVPVGDGCIISGIGKGLREMQQLGVIDRLPRLIGVQAQGAAPLAAAYERFKAGGGESLQPVVAHTIADSINVGRPRNWRKALRMTAALGGDFVTVSDDEITQMMPRLGASTGVFAEPTAVAALAGARTARAAGLIDARERVLVLLTGSGLKDVEGALRSVRMPAPIKPQLGEVVRAISVA